MGLDAGRGGPSVWPRRPARHARPAMRLVLPRALVALVLAALAVPVVAQDGPARPDGPRLFLAPTARAVPGGAGQLGVAMFVVPNAVLGAGRGVSVGAGVLPITGALLAEAKWSVVDRPGLAVAVGATAQANPNRYADAYALPFAVATVGRGGAAATVGVGGRVGVQAVAFPNVGFRDDPGRGVACPAGGPCSAADEWYRGRRERVVHGVRAPAGFAGAEVRVNRELTLVAEATAVPAQSVVDAAAGGDGVGGREVGPVRYFLSGAAGVRVAVGRAVLDLGAVATSDDDGATVVRAVAPWFGVSVGVGG